MGWKPGVPDIRDWRHNFKGARVASSVDLRTTGHFPSIWDQGQLGSCTSHAAGAAYVFDLHKQGNIVNPDDFMPSRLFHYYQERVIEGTVSEDSGATIADSVKAMNQYGLPPEAEWPYVEAKYASKPPAQAYTDALLRQALKYARVTRTVADFQACLTAGTPIMIGFSVYDSFESNATAANGVVTIPRTSESLLGGHAVLVVGYLSGMEVADKLKADGFSTTNLNTSANYWVCRNSWSADWGHKGYFYMPQSYLMNSSLASDFWTLQQVESPDPAPTPPQPTPTPTPVPPSPDPTPTPTPTPAPASTLDRAAVLAKIDELKAWATSA